MISNPLQFRAISRDHLEVKDGKGLYNIYMDEDGKWFAEYHATDVRIATGVPLLVDAMNACERHRELGK